MYNFVIMRIQSSPGILECKCHPFYFQYHRITETINHGRYVKLLTDVNIIYIKQDMSTLITCSRYKYKMTNVQSKRFIQNNHIQLFY